MATHGHLKNSKISIKDGQSALPESSLTWCISQLSKVSLAANNQISGTQQTELKHCDGRDKTNDNQKKLQASQWRALVAIRTQHIKGGNSRISRYRVQGGLPPLLSVLRRSDTSRKTLDLALSILANCCTERDARREVRKLEGVSVLVDIMKKHVSVETLRNRAARALGNLAMDPEGSALVHSAGGIPPLLLCLSLSPPPSSPSPSSSSPSPSPSSPNPSSPSPPALPSPAKLECAQSAARALLYLADTPAHRLSLLSHGALQGLAPLLSPELPLGLRRASLRALHDLTRGCTAECAREMSRSGALAHLGVLIAASKEREGEEEEEKEEEEEEEEEDTKALEELTLKTLANLCTQGCLRPLVGSLGAVQKFTEEVKRDPGVPRTAIFLRALCLCCKEAVNRVKVKESGGLEVLIGFLAAHQNHPLTRLAILACVDFVYDESALEHLQDLGLIPLLVARLVEHAKGEETVTKAELSPSAASDLMSPAGYESFDFPHPDGNRKDDVGKEQGAGSSSFLSLKSWLVSEGLISSEGDLLESSAGVESDCGSSHASSPSVASSSPTLSVLDAASSFATCPSPNSAVAQPNTVASSRLAPLSPLSQLAPHSTQRNMPTSPSAPQSPPLCIVPKPTSPSKICSPPKKRPRVSSSSSSSSGYSTSSSSLSTLSSSSTTSSCSSMVSLEAPPVMSKTPVYQHPYHPEPWAPESPVLLLLSRFSHASDPSAALVNAGVLSGLLYYLTQHRDPSGRCFRMLSRLSCNPNCLQALLRTGAVALIRHDLCLRSASGGVAARRGKDRQTDRVKAKVRRLGLGLLSNLRVQCEAGFGTGVLSHIMLSGVEVDRMFCALSLPLICSNKVLLKKLLLDNGGLVHALDPLLCTDDGKEEDNSSRAEKCHNFLSSWLCPPQQEVTSSRLHSLYTSLLIGCLSSLLAHGKTELDQKRVSSAEPPPQPMTDTAACSTASIVAPAKDTGSDAPPSPKKPCRSASSCSYTDATHDIFLRLDDGSQVPACRAALEGGEEESGDGGSEYFRALLTGGFGEAQRCQDGQAIPIRDVHYGVLLPVLHYLHGCRVDAGDNGAELKTQGTSEEDATAAAAAPARCSFLESLFKPKGWVTTSDFQKSALSEGMVGACRFLVTGLQRDAEHMCVALLRSCAALINSSAAAAAAASLPQRLPKSSVLPDDGSSRKTVKRDGVPRPLQQPSKVLKTPLASGPKSTSKTTKPQDPKVASSKDGEQQQLLRQTPLKSSSSQDIPRVSADEASEERCSSLARLLPQMYWFSQRYNYPRLGKACLAVLLRPQGHGACRGSLASCLPPAQAAECLLQLSKDADSREDLKQDLLQLAATALS
ncbi:armadillo repeat-containing protein 5 [Engraulis encrasicolus]|uniref:armadillo repeat-containing protein 5 n=1 Tax=Engraulis encrasicolus TaxID=184585 RepID=UPI002FCE958B